KGEIPKNIRQLSPSKDAREIKYFSRINEDIKKKFVHQGNQSKLTHHMNLEKGGPVGSGAEVGKIWHRILKKYIDNPEQHGDGAGEAVIKALQSEGNIVKDIKFLQTEFPLYGFISDKETLEISFWNGNADAIGWFDDRYVIVDWKAVDLLLFWEKNKHAYGDYLHQCLVYARLLQLHLGLDELPHILIVPISNKTGKEIHPAMFNNVPDECKNEIQLYNWSKVPISVTKKIKNWMVKDAFKNSDVPDDTKVQDVFNDDVTVRQLLDALTSKLTGLKVED
ncbi:Hypothetical predicted protein, partial [Paramuricea clavata]